MTAAEIDTMPNVSDWTTERLKECLARGFLVIRSRMLEMAACLQELESRGEKVDGDKFMIRLLRKMAQGELLVDVVVRFAGRPYTMASVARLPVDEQQQLLGKTDAEVEKQFHRPKGHKHPPEKCQSTAPNLFGIAANASPGDVAEMIMKIIEKSRDPKAVAEKLIPQLQRVKNKRSQDHWE